MEQILLAYGLPIETIATIMMLYKNTKVKTRSPNGNTYYFGIVAGVLHGDTLAPILFIICLDYALRAYTPAQAKTLLHSLERAAAGIGLHVNADKMEYICFNQRGDISTLNGSSLKLVDKILTRD